VEDVLEAQRIRNAIKARDWTMAQTLLASDLRQLHATTPPVRTEDSLYELGICY
jgi:hypothetical protein